MISASGENLCCSGRPVSVAGGCHDWHSATQRQSTWPPGPEPQTATVVSGCCGRCCACHTVLGGWVQVQVLKILDICPKMLPWLMYPLNVGHFPLLLKTLNLQPLLWLPCMGKVVCAPEWPLRYPDLFSYSPAEDELCCTKETTIVLEEVQHLLPSWCLSVILVFITPLPSPIVTSTSLTLCLFISFPHSVSFLTLRNSSKIGTYLRKLCLKVVLWGSDVALLSMWTHAVGTQRKEGMEN